MKTRFSIRGFSLMEMLIVIAIIIAIASLVVPGTTSALNNNNLSRAAQILLQQLASARQTAVAKNRRVEVRFYRFDDPDLPGADQYFRAVQSFLIADDNTAKPLGKIERLPGSIALLNSVEASPLLDVPDKAYGPGDVPVKIPRVSGYATKAFQFRPDGSTNLELGKAFLSAASVRSPADASATQLSGNYIVVQVDRLGGGVRLYRP